MQFFHHFSGKPNKWICRNLELIWFCWVILAQMLELFCQNAWVIFRKCLSYFGQNPWVTFAKSLSYFCQDEKWNSAEKSRQSYENFLSISHVDIESFVHRTINHLREWINNLMLVAIYCPTLRIMGNDY